MSDQTNKDAEQDSKLAVLESKIESFRERIHALEAETSGVSVIDSTLENAIRRFVQKCFLPSYPRIIPSAFPIRPPPTPFAFLKT